MKTFDELAAYLESNGSLPRDYKLAVGSLIFGEDNKVLLLKRGTAVQQDPEKMEGVGGSVDSTDIDLHHALLREITEEIGEVEVSIDQLLTVLVSENVTGSGEWWVIPQYLCRLTKGVPFNCEPNISSGIHYFSLEEIELDVLSDFEQKVIVVYREKYGNEPYYIKNEGCF